VKILFIKEQRSPTGIEGIGIYLLNVCIELNKLKVPYLILYNAEDELYKKMLVNNINVRIVDFLLNSAKNMFQYKKVQTAQKLIYKIIKNENITHVNVHFPYLLQLVKKEWNIPIIVHWHGAFINNKPAPYLYLKDILSPRKLLTSIYNKKVAFNFDKADMVICPGIAAKNTASEYFKVPSNKIKINPYGVKEINTNDFKCLKNELGFKSTDKIIISVGRETKAKGVEDFCNVAMSLQHKTNYKFLFIGGYRDKNYHDELVANYGHCVQFMGMRQNINDFYKTADLFLFLSHRESAGLVLAEAMYFSLPLVTWDIIGVNEMFKNENNGYLCKFGNIDDIKKSLVKVLDNKEIYSKFSKESLIEASNHTIDKSTLELIELIEMCEK
jgi:glycosyltransferase involved in cell wall biosynthesis